MSSIIKVDNIQDQDGNNIISESSNTLTIGNSNSKISGIGTVNWDTTKKTAAFTADSGRGYFVDTSSAAITVTLPATPSAGDIVSISDYNGSFGTNNCTVGRNSSNINGEASDWVIAINDTSITFVYVDATEGWRVTNTSLPSETLNPFLVASGGTETTCGNFKIHTFTGPGTFTVCSVGATPTNNVVDYLVVAGGGAGGALGGGGAGGYRESCGTCYTSSPLGSCVSALPVTAQGYPITVGAGGAGFLGPQPETVNNPGSNSVFSTITSAGGGMGGHSSSPTPATGKNGGSGGGGGGTDSGNGPGGSGNTPPVSPPQGNNGGNGSPTPGTRFTAGGGGGATAAGSPGPGPGTGGAGGAGATSSINATPTARAGGGGGGSYVNGGGGSGGAGGTGGGGAGSFSGGGAATDGTANTGGGGGGRGVTPAGTGNPTSGAGGSGIVIIRYKYQ